MEKYGTGGEVYRDIESPDKEAGTRYPQQLGCKDCDLHAIP